MSIANIFIDHSTTGTPFEGTPFVNGPTAKIRPAYPLGESGPIWSGLLFPTMPLMLPAPPELNPEPEAEPDPVRPLTSIESMDGYLASYGRILGKKAVTSLHPLHVPNRDELPDFEDIIDHAPNREPFPCQKHVIAAGVELLNTNRSGFICGEMGTGKGGLPTTRVLTPEGWTTLGEILVGEEIVDPAGGTTTVTGVFRRGVMPMYRVAFTDGSSTVCSDDHLWLVNTPLRKWRGQPGRVLELRAIREKGLAHKNGNLQHFIPLVSPVTHPSRNLPVDPYLLGQILGNGSLSNGSVGITIPDWETVERIEALVRPLALEVKHRENYDYRLSSERGQGNTLTQRLREMGLIGSKSEDKFIPPDYLFASEPQRIRLLQGLLDTDGGIANKDGTGIEFSTVSPRLAEGVRDLVRSLGGVVTTSTKIPTYTYNGEKREGQLAYRLYVSLPSDIQPFKLGRKLAAYRPKTKYEPTRAICSIEPIGDHECICISVASESKLYVTDDYIVTHNTLLAMTSVFKHAQQPRSKGGSNGKFRCLVLCPDHLIAKWKREIEETIPGAKVYHFGSLSKDDAKARKKEDGKTGQRPAINDLINLLDKRHGDRWSKPDGPEYYVIGRDQVKWLPDWFGTSDPYKGFNCVGGLLGGHRVVRKVGTQEDGTPITLASQVQGIASANPVEKPLSSANRVVDRVMVKDEYGSAVTDERGVVKYKAVTARVFTCPKCGNVVRDRKGVPVSAQAISKNQMKCEGRYLQQVPTPDRAKSEHGLDKITPMPDKFKDRTSGHVSIGTNRYEVKTCGEPLWWYVSKKYRYPLARIIQRKFRRFFKYLIVDECHEQQSDEAGQSMAAGKLIGVADHVLALTGTLIGGYAKNLYALVMRICPKTLREEGFEWGKDLEFSKIYGKIDRIITTKEESGSPAGAKKAASAMRRAKTGQGKERTAVRPGIMPTLFGRHMLGNTVFIALDEMAEGLPDMFEYIGGECPPPPEPTGNAEADDAEMDRYERMKEFWVDTACTMEPAQYAEYNRIEATLDHAAKELLKRGSMKLLGTMLATTLGWPDFAHAEWAMDDDLVKSLKDAAGDPDKQAPALLGQSFLRHFEHSFDPETEHLILKRSGEMERIPLAKSGGVFWLDVTINDKTRRFIYDTGASSISIPLMMANELGMAPTTGDPEVMVQVADGRLVKSKRKTAKSVKVGKFSVENVECNIDIPGSDTHTVGYWDKPGDKDIKNWCGVVTPKPTGADKVYPKEQALVDICKLHKKAGHQTWVYVQMTGKRNVMPRLKTILEREGLKVGIMKSGDVEPKEREAWIADHGREFDVMICFPKLVSTGLDLFSKVQGGHNYNCIVFYETGYKLNEMRQAARRAWRIGQPRDCYIYYLYYQETMQHRAMSLMSKKMAAALALEGEFSEEGLAALSGEGDEQMALAKSMSEKIDDADMQRSWQKVQSQNNKKKPAKKKPVDAIAALAADAKPSPLDALPEEMQLVAETMLERQAKELAEADEAAVVLMVKGDMYEWTRIGGAVKIGRFTGETVDGYDKFECEGRIEWVKVGQSRPVALEPGESITLGVHEQNEMVDATLVGTFTIEDGDGNVLFSGENKIVTNGINAEIISVDEADNILGQALLDEVTDFVEGRINEDAVVPWSSVEPAEAELAALEDLLVNPPEPIKVDDKLVAKTGRGIRLHQPEPEPAPKKVHAVVDDIILDDELLAKMMANMASHGMSASDFFA